MDNFILPQNKRPLYLLYYFVANLGTLIPFNRFEEVNISYEDRAQLAIGVSTARKFLEPLGYQIESVREFGYKCIKQEAFKWKR